MALSNWDTFAVGFKAVRTHLPNAITQEINAKLRVLSDELRAAGDGFLSEAAQEIYEAQHERLRADAYTREGYAPLSFEHVESEGSFTTRGHVSVDVYKNWLYLRSEKMWVPDSGFIDPTIAQIHEGSLTIGGANITAWRGPQDGVYVVVCEDEYGENGRKDDEPWIVTTRGMAASGVYGFAEFSIPRTWKRIDVTTCTNEACDWCQPSDEDDPGECPECGERVREQNFVPDDNDHTPWEGTRESSLAWFKAKIELEFVDHDVLSQVDPLVGRRFNQGDAYLAQALGLEDPTQGIGENSTEPLLMQVVNEWKKNS